MQMRMNLSPVDFRSTPVENLFLDTYLSQASGEALKVYLYGWKACQTDPGRTLTLEELVDNLDLTPDQVMEALAYWMNQDLVDLVLEEGQEIYVFKSIVLLWLGKYDKAQPAGAAGAEALAATGAGDPSGAGPADMTPQGGLTATQEGEAWKAMFDQLEAHLSEGQTYQVKLKPNEILLIQDFLARYPVTPDFFLYAYQEAEKLQETSSRNIRYITAIIENWVRFEKLTDIPALQDFLAHEQVKRAEAKKGKRQRAKAQAKNLKAGPKMKKEEREAWVKQKLEASRTMNLRGDQDEQTGE